MKKIKLFALVVLASAVMFTSCSDDEVENPTVAVTVDNATPNKGDTVNFTVAISGNEKIKELTITETEPNANASEVKTVTDFGGAYSYSHVYTYVVKQSGLNEGDIITVTFKVTNDKDGEASETGTITITTPAATGTAFAVEKTTGMFYHIAGLEHGAYDLDGDATVGSSGDAATKSMMNSDVAGATFTGSWTSENGTTFVKDNTYDYANAFTETAETAFTNGSASGTVTNPAIDDIYIAKKGSTLYVIKITGFDTTTGSGTNKGQIKFSYRKN